MKCECEHSCHFDSRLVNDPPRHVYGADFGPNMLKLVKTVMGRFLVCYDCASNCEGYQS